MNTLTTLHLHCNHHSYLANIPQIISSLPKSSINAALSKPRRNPTRITGRLEIKSPNVLELPVDCSRMVMLGAMSLGVAVLLMGFDEHKALALGPEGPLMEEFWDNMRRYALYALTVSTGAIYTLLQPIVELLKNPISALLVLLIFGGGIFIVSQVVTAMVGLSDFSYDYGY